MSLTFGSGVRLRSRAEFTAVQARGRRVATRWLTLLGMPNARGHDRLGIIASRRIGGAVTRNRAKRRVRELFRVRDADTARAANPRALDLVVIPRREAAEAPFTLLQTEFLAALTRLRGSRFS